MNIQLGGGKYRQFEDCLNFIKKQAENNERLPLNDVRFRNFFVLTGKIISGKINRRETISNRFKEDLAKNRLVKCIQTLRAKLL